MDAYSSEWSSFDNDGFAAELSTIRGGGRRKRDRQSERLHVNVGAGLRQRGASGVSVRVLDLSPHGFRAATHLVLYEGSDVWLRLPGLEPRHAQVAWAEGHFIGCSFVRPLHPAVVAMIVDKADSTV